MNVRTTTPAAPNPESVREERVLYERSLFGVLAGILGNCAAGVGAGFLAGVACHWAGLSAYTTTRVVVSAWLATWGLLMIAWFGADEFTVLRLRHQRAELADDLEAAEDEIESLQADLATTSGENAMLRWKNEELRRAANFIAPVEVDTQAYADAKALIRQWGETGAHPARRATNLTDARHRAALDVLQACNVIDRPTPNRVEWLAADAAAALDMVARRGARHHAIPEVADPSAPTWVAGG